MNDVFEITYRNNKKIFHAHLHVTFYIFKYFQVSHSAQKKKIKK